MLRLFYPLNFFIWLFGLIILADSMKIGERLPYNFNTNGFGTHTTTYQQYRAPLGTTADTAVVCIHGFGGNADQFRKNMPVFAAAGVDTFGIDLLGYGYGDKPSPKQYEVNALYNFETWSLQVRSFITDVVKKPCVLVCNSVGGVAGLTTALDEPQLVKEVIPIDISLRLLHIKKQTAIQRQIVPVIQRVLRETNIGKIFFKQVATPNALRNILNQAYGYPGKTTRGVDDEIIDLILQPGLDPGAVEVFLDFISYRYYSSVFHHFIRGHCLLCYYFVVSGGPLPEEILPLLKTPVTFLWGEHDPWEPLDLAKDTLASFPCVKDFVVLPDSGHCPMDQVPDRVNAEVLKVVAKYVPNLKLSASLLSSDKSYA